MKSPLVQVWLLVLHLALCSLDVHFPDSRVPVVGGSERCLNKVCLKSWQRRDSLECHHIASDFFEVCVLNAFHQKNSHSIGDMRDDSGFESK